MSQSIFLECKRSVYQDLRLDQSGMRGSNGVCTIHGFLKLEFRKVTNLVLQSKVLFKGAVSSFYSQWFPYKNYIFPI